MAPTAAYDEIADWYENEFLAATDVDDPIGVRRALETLLGPGSGSCLELGCGTGVYAAQVRSLGRTPFGVDLSAGMLGYARDRLPVGTFVHIGVHPAFCGGFADRTDPAAVVIRPGYLDGHWTKNSWTTQGVRDKVGASHFPLPVLLRAFLDAGLTLTGFLEGGAVVPTTLSIRAVSS